MRLVTQHFIDGEFVDSHGQEMLDLKNPATNEVIGRVTLGDEHDVERAVAAAKRALPSWSATSLEERTDWLQRLADAVEGRIGELTELFVLEYGSTAMMGGWILGDARDFFLQAKDLLKPGNFVETIGEATVTKVPIGVAGLLSPWNGSPWFVCAKASLALAAGCTTVIKPSELSALQNQALMKCFAEAGLPAGVINVVNGAGPVVGNAITRSPDVQKISFTGSTRVGKQIMRDAAETMKRFTLELGGKPPIIILDDADLDAATSFALMVGLFNSGQSCLAGTRILVPESRLDEVKGLLKQKMEAMKVGPGSDPATQIFPMVTAARYDAIQDYIRKGVAEGAEILTGGEGKPAGLEAGNFVKPTIFANVRNDMTIAQEEIFGPVLAVISYKDEDEAITIANDVVYGLHAYIATSDRGRGERVAAQLLAGRVAINELLPVPMVPFGGFKQSGIGREFGLYGLQAFLELRAVFGKP